MKISASAVELGLEVDFWDTRDLVFVNGLCMRSSVTTRLSKPKTIVNFFFIYIYIFNTHGAGNQRT